MAGRPAPLPGRRVGPGLRKAGRVCGGREGRRRGGRATAGPAGGPGTRDAVRTQPVRRVAQRGQVREERAVLRYPGDATAVRSRRGDVAVAEAEGGAGSRGQAEKGPQQGGLARAVGADHRDGGARFGVEGELGEAGDVGVQRPTLLWPRGVVGGKREAGGVRCREVGVLGRGRRGPPARPVGGARGPSAAQRRPGRPSRWRAAAGRPRWRLPGSPGAADRPEAAESGWCRADCPRR